MALGLTQHLNRNEYQEFSWGVNAADLTAICELIV
jgi:hypothetical protein